MALICQSSACWTCSIPHQNGVLAGVYPASPSSWLIVVIAMMSSLYTRVDPSLGMIGTIKENLPCRSETSSISTSSLEFNALSSTCFVFKLLHEVEVSWFHINCSRFFISLLQHALSQLLAQPIFIEVEHWKCVSPEQRLYVSADPGSPECHPVCNRPVALPHLPLEVHPQSSALLPWLDLWISREDDHIHQSLAGECVTLSWFFLFLLFTTPPLHPISPIPPPPSTHTHTPLCLHASCSSALFECYPCRGSPESCEDVFWTETAALQLPSLPATASCAKCRWHSPQGV